MRALSKRRLTAAVALVVAAAAAATGGLALAGSSTGTSSAKGLGPINGLLPRDHLTVESAIQVNLSKESVRPPLHEGRAANTALIDARRNGGDLLNVFGDFPSEKDPRHAEAFSPLWDVQLGLWTEKAVTQHPPQERRPRRRACR